MAIPRGKSAPSPSPISSSSTENPSVSLIPSTGTDAEKAEVAAKIEQPDPASVSPPSSPLQSARPDTPASSLAPHPAVVISSPAVATVPVSDDDLPSILRRLTPIQRAKLRSAAISEGVIQSGAGSGRENPDGSLTVMIRVDGDLVPQLKTWAEEAGTDLASQVREIVGQLLSGYLMGPWEPPQPVATAADGTTTVAK